MIPLRIFSNASLCHSKSSSHLEIIESATLAVSNAKIVFSGPNSKFSSFLNSNPQFEISQTHDLTGKLLVPGFVDTHAHAPQYGNAGCGIGLPLLDWLEAYTFPRESKYSDLTIANHEYSKSVRRHLKQGTTTCCYFATIHEEASVLLAQIMQNIGQRGFVGKVNMDRNSPANYIEPSAQSSLESTRRVIEKIKALSPDGFVQPAITPRFVPTCSEELLIGLGKLAREHNLLIQSHNSENSKEIAWVKQLHPECETNTHVFERYGLLTPRSIMAHCIHLNEEERELLKSRQTAVAHCPISNFNLQSGVFHTRKALDQGIKVGLGSDVSAGHSTSILDVIQSAVIASTVQNWRGGEVVEHWDDKLKQVIFVENGGRREEEVEENDRRMFASQRERGDSIGIEEGFYMATLGGADCLGLGDKIGNFEVGKEFDALVVDVRARDSAIDVFEDDDVLDVFSKWIYLGDDRNVESIYVGGKRVDVNERA